MDEQIFTTGAYLIPIQIDDRWVWMVSSFEDETFKDGESFNPPEAAESLNELLTNTTKQCKEQS